MDKANQREIEPRYLQKEASKLIEAVDRLLDVMMALKKIIISRVVYFETHSGIFRKTLVRRCLEVCIDVDGFFYQGSLAGVCREAHMHTEKLACEHKRLRDSTMLH
eukprot:jgi/Antlo1/2109/2306